MATTFKVTTTSIWAPGGRTRALPDWEWAWSIKYRDEYGKIYDQTCKHLFKDRGECEREMRQAIEKLEGR
jgi:hypothetical protein